MHHVPRAHRRRKMKYDILRAPEHLESRSSASTGLQPSATDGSKELSPTSTALIVSIIFVVTILITLGVYIYVRHRHKYSTTTTKSRGFEFNKDDFADAKKSPSSPELDKHLVAGPAELSSSTLSPTDHYRKSSLTYTSDDRTLRRQPQGNLLFRIANGNGNEKMAAPTLAVPKLAAQKGKPPRSKPVWLSPIITGEVARSPPPAYGMSSAGQEILIPIPPQRPPQKAKATPMPPTPPVTRKSRASIRSKTSPMSLVIPSQGVSVTSPARSESFAPKDLAPPSPSTPPASSISVLDSAGTQIGSSRVEHDTHVKLPRLMSVVALFTPNLPDELHVKIGDTIRVIEEYKDGWCFVQFLGRKDAPRGMVPLVCLQQRKRLVPLTHNASNSSSMTSNWR